MLPPTIFFAAGFNLVVLTTQLLLNDYSAQFAGLLSTRWTEVRSPGCPTT
jgi:hypothetical protein